MRHDDAYQMLAYCIAYGLPRGYLVYAKDSGEESRRHRLRNIECEIVVRAIDIERKPETFAQIDQLADAVVADRAMPIAA